MPVCNEEGRKVIRMAAETREKQKLPFGGFSAEYVVKDCPGTEVQMDTVVKYLNVLTMVVKINGRGKTYEIFTNGHYLAYKEWLPELVKKAQADKARPKAKLDL